MGRTVQVKIQGTYMDSPVMTLHAARFDDNPDLVIRVGAQLAIELSQSEALALAADLIRAVNR